MTYPAAARRGYLEVTARVAPENREAAAAVYLRYREPFLAGFPGAQDKQLLIRDDDVQVLHSFDAVSDAHAYVASELFTRDVVGALAPLLAADPEVRIYESLEAA